MKQTIKKIIHDSRMYDKDKYMQQSQSQKNVHEMRLNKTRKLLYMHSILIE